MKIKKKTLKQNYSENESYLDLSLLAKGLILFGIILLITNFMSLWIIPFLISIIFIGIILLFIDTLFVKLSEFAQEVESGEFEKKVLKELDTK